MVRCFAFLNQGRKESSLNVGETIRRAAITILLPFVSLIIASVYQLNSYLVFFFHVFKNSAAVRPI